MENILEANSEAVEDVFEQYDKVRRNGFCEIYDRACYRMVAQKWGMDELVEAIDNENFLKILRGYSDWNTRLLQSYKEREK